jgi:hypothetical protein
MSVKLFWCLRNRKACKSFIMYMQNKNKTVQRRIWGSSDSSGMKSSVFWDITPCSPLKVNWCFEGTCLHFQSQRISQARNQCESRWKAEDGRCHVPLKCQLTFNRLHSIMSQKIRTLWNYTRLWNSRKLHLKSLLLSFMLCQAFFKGSTKLITSFHRGFHYWYSYVA